MKKYISFIAAVLASATLMLVTAPAQAGPVHVDLNIGIPLPFFVQSGPVYMQPAPVYAPPSGVVVYSNPGYYGYQQQWRERDWRDHHEWHDQYWDNRNYYRDDRRHDERHGDRHEHDNYDRRGGR